MNDILPDTLNPDDINNELHKPVKIHFDYNAITCESCKKVITDGKIFRNLDDPTKGLCFDCCYNYKKKGNIKL